MSPIISVIVEASPLLFICGIVLAGFVFGAGAIIGTVTCLFVTSKIVDKFMR